MAMKRRKLLVEPAAVATGDIAFNLIVFFLVCASVQPDSGRKQDIPKSESKQEKTEQSQNIEVEITRTGVRINSTAVLLPEFYSRVRRALETKTRPEDRIVVVKSSKDTPYDHWIYLTGLIEQAGGIITLQMEEERQVQLPD